MPRVVSKPGGEMMVAIDSGCFQEPDGTEHIVLMGMRLKSSHPVVRLSPHTFVPASLDDFEIKQARRDLLEARGIHGRD